MDERSRAAVVAAEERAEGQLSQEELEAIEQSAYEAAEAYMENCPELSWKASPTFHAMWASAGWTGAMSGRRPIFNAARSTQDAMAWHLAPEPHNREKRREIQEAEAKHQMGMLRCIFGNPFSPVQFDDACRTSNVVALAQSIYHQHAFDRFSILADALEEAGCINAEILAHCRGPGFHVRGCWVVDLLLKKE